MKLQLLLFGITADLLQTQNTELEVKESISLLSFKAVLKTTYPQLKNIDSYAFAVNETYADNDTILKENDVVAIIPPVSGG